MAARGPPGGVGDDGRMTPAEEPEAAPAPLPAPGLEDLLSEPDSAPDEAWKRVSC